MLRIPLARIPGHILDPVGAYHHMCHLTPSDMDIPAFSYFQDSKLVTFTHTTFVKMLRSLLRDVGLPAQLYSGHSFRRGGLTCGFQSGVPVQLLRAHGDWNFEAYQQYLSFTDDQRLGVTQAMADKLIKSVL